MSSEYIHDTRVLHCMDEMTIDQTDCRRPGRFGRALAFSTEAENINPKLLLSSKIRVKKAKPWACSVQAMA